MAESDDVALLRTATGARRHECPDCGSGALIRYKPTPGVMGPGDECLRCGWFQAYREASDG